MQHGLTNRAISGAPSGNDPIAPVRNQDPSSLMKREQVSVPITKRVKKVSHFGQAD